MSEHDIQGWLMTNENNAEHARFEEFAEADLLDLVEGTMTPEAAKELAEIVKIKHPELLGTLTRMQADRLALESHLDMEPPLGLFADVTTRSQQPRVQIDRDFQEAVEPTAMMERSLRDLGRRRRRRRQAPMIAAIAAGIAGIGVTIGIMMLLQEVNSSREKGIGLSESFARIDDEGPSNSSTAFTSEAIVSEYGLVLRGVEEGVFGGQLANLLAFGDVVVVENLTLDQSVRNRTGGNDKLRAAIQAGNSSIILESEMLPPPLVGSLEQAPSASIRLDLAERGFQYAIVINQSEAASTVAQIGKLADSASLVPAHVEPNDNKFVFDAWKEWQSRAKATSDSGGSSQRLIVPISCGGSLGSR